MLIEDGPKVQSWGLMVGSWRACGGYPFPHFCGLAMPPKKRPGDPAPKRMLQSAFGAAPKKESDRQKAENAWLADLDEEIEIMDWKPGDPDSDGEVGDETPGWPGCEDDEDEGPKAPAAQGGSPEPSAPEAAASSRAPEPAAPEPADSSRVPEPAPPEPAASSRARPTTPQSLQNPVALSNVMFPHCIALNSTLSSSWNSFPEIFGAVQNSMCMYVPALVRLLIWAPGNSMYQYFMVLGTIESPAPNISGSSPAPNSFTKKDLRKEQNSKRKEKKINI